MSVGLSQCCAKSIPDLWNGELAFPVQRSLKDVNMWNSKTLIIANRMPWQPPREKLERDINHVSSREHNCLTSWTLAEQLLELIIDPSQCLQAHYTTLVSSLITLMVQLEQRRWVLPTWLEVTYKTDPSWLTNSSAALPEYNLKEVIWEKGIHYLRILVLAF